MAKNATLAATDLEPTTVTTKGKRSPQTETGTQAASRNATKHRLHARTLEPFAPVDPAQALTLARLLLLLIR